MSRLLLTTACLLALAALPGCGADSPAATADAALTVPADASGADSADSAAAPDVPLADSASPDTAPADSGPTCPGSPGCACQVDFECDDGLLCTEGQACVDGACDAGFAVGCDDGDACTADFCVEAGDPRHRGWPTGCTHVVQDGPCQDGNACTAGDLCQDGQCVSGAIKPCDDGNPCTDDSCAPAQGCVFAHNAAPCSPGDACVEPSFCAWGSCPANKAIPCNDDNPCTWDTCDPKTGCQKLAVPAPAPCPGAETFGRCYAAFASKGTWAAARVACQQWGGELTSVRDKYENGHVRALADATCGKGSVWLGLSDIAQEGHFRWTDNTPTGFWGFSKTEPNDAGGEDVVELTADGTWNDVGAGAELGCFVCARPVQTSCDKAGGCTTGALCASGTCQAPVGPKSCDDGNPCTADACSDGKGCGHTALADGASCGGTGSCEAGFCLLPEAAALATSCAAILAAEATATSGVYWLDADGSGPAPKFQAFCDMVADGGGWTLALEVDGNAADAAYGGALWTGKTAQGNAIPDGVPGRLPSFWLLPVQQIRVGLRSAKQPDAALRWLVLDVAGPSLQALFEDGKPVPTQAGLQAWKALLPGASMQANCHAEGLNVVSTGTAKVRIGILGNNEDDCSTVDSWLGLGAVPGICGTKDVPTGGNVACWQADNGFKAAAAVGVVLVR